MGSPQLGPRAPGGGLAGFRRGGGRNRWGEGGGGLVAHLGLDFFGWKGAGRLRRAALAAPVGTGRRNASAGVRSVGARKWAAWATLGVGGG
jgi:hypothetical protein